MSGVIKNNKNPLSLYKSNIYIDLNSSTVLTDDIWNYVLMFLRRNTKNDVAIDFWRQSNSFYNAYKVLPENSKALLGYYTILNASKALLSFKGINYKETHGSHSSRKGVKCCLANEKTTMQGSGILFELSKYLLSANGGEIVSIKDIFHNLVFCSRAFNFTYKSEAAELFLPIDNIEFRLNKKTKKGRLYFTINKKNYNGSSLKSIGKDFELVDKKQCDEANDFFKKGLFLIRSKKDFENDKKFINFINYHIKIRKNFSYIKSSQKLWYVKKINNKNSIDKPSLVLIYAAMHELSEMERYHPEVLNRYSKTNENWLISEFLHNAVNQFIDEIACEITGQNIYPPGFRS